MLAESKAILRYLADRERRDDLYPVGYPAARAVEQLLDRYASPFRAAFFRSRRRPWASRRRPGSAPTAPDPETARARHGEIAPLLRTFDARGRLPRLRAGRFTLADSPLLPSCTARPSTGMDLSPYPNLLHWRDTVCARPAFAAADPVQ